MFTAGQKERMQALFATNGARADLATSQGCAPVAIITNSTSICQGTSTNIQLNTLNISNVNSIKWYVNGVYNPAWDGLLSITVTPNIATIYPVDFTYPNQDGVSVTSSLSSTVTVNNLPVATINRIDYNCNTDKFTLRASGGVAYEWEVAPYYNQTIEVSPGTYTVTVTDNAGCTDTASETVVSGNPSDGIDHIIGTASDNPRAVQDANNPNVYYWNPQHLPYVTGNIVVPNGKSLYLNNTTTIKMLMPEGSKITVEPGASLFVKSGKIVGACTWKGIEVKAADEAPYIRGYVFLDNAVIENAEIGIVAGTNDNGAGAGNGRGNIYCKQTTFRNNTYDVWHSWNPMTGNGGFGPQETVPTIWGNITFTAPHYFEKCLFVTDDNYPFPIRTDMPPVHLFAIKNNGDGVQR